jgi:hypothetical protein
VKARWKSRSVTVLAGAVVTAVALGGIAFAASTSGGTISVCVHHKGGGLYKAARCAHSDRTLSWNARGPQGRPGVAGGQGGQGEPGIQGEPGPITGALPSAVTLTGAWVIEGPAGASGQEMSTAISFPLTPVDAPTVVIVAPNATATTQCPGSVSAPEAEAGVLCVYEAVAANGPVAFANPVTDSAGTSSQFGVELTETSLGAGDFNAIGTWALSGS